MVGRFIWLLWSVLLFSVTGTFGRSTSILKLYFSKVVTIILITLKSKKAFSGYFKAGKLFYIIAAYIPHLPYKFDIFIGVK